MCLSEGRWGFHRADRVPERLERFTRGFVHPGNCSFDDWFVSLGVNFNTDKVNSTDDSEINREPPCAAHSIKEQETHIVFCSFYRKNVKRHTDNSSASEIKINAFC